MTPYYPPPLHTVYVYTVYLFKRRGEGGGVLIREKVRGAIVHQSRLKIPTRLTVYELY
jgi:hypothetical protein